MSRAAHSADRGDPKMFFPFLVILPGLIAIALPMQAMNRAARWLSRRRD